MRAYIKREQNIIAVADDFASLYKIDSDDTSLAERNFHYKIEYIVNPEKAFRNKAITTEIFVSPTPFVVQSQKIFDRFNPEESILGIQLRNQRLKDRARSANATNDNSVFVPKITSDITRFISNSSVALFKTNSNLQLENSQTVLKRVLSIKPQQVSGLTNSNTKMPVLEINTNPILSNTIIANSLGLKQKAISLLFQKKVDPASFVGGKSNTIIPAKNSFFGTIAKNVTRTFSEYNILTDSLLTTTRRESSSGLGDSEIQNVPVEESTTSIIVQEDFTIPVSYIDAGEFYFVFRIKNNKGLILQTVSGLVNHSKQVSTWKIPNEPPVIVAPQKAIQGEITLNLKQVDPNGTAIKVYKKVFSSHEAMQNASYSLVGQVNCTPKNGFVYMKDEVNSITPVIYRAVSVNSNGTVGSEFSSVVVEADRGQVATTHAINIVPNFVSISSTVAPEKIVLQVNNFPADAISFELLRKNLSLKESSYTRIGTPILLDSIDSSAIVIQDISLQRNHIFEYVVKLLYRTGTSVLSSVPHVVKFAPITNNIITLELGPADIARSGGNELNVTFSINKKIIQNSADQVKNFLTKQGFLGEFQEDIVDNREKLGNLFAIGIKRQNLTTGEIEDYGILDNDEEFSDVVAGAYNGVSSLKEGNEYKYMATAYARNIESVLPTLVRTNEDNINLPYTYKPSEWTHPITAEDGSLITTNSLKRNHAARTFTFGTVADYQEKTVSLAAVLPALFDGKAKYLNGRNSVLVQWKIQGDANLIDHFIIILDILGMKTIVGKTHNISTTNYFQFIDSLDNKESGGLTYFIVPVYFDYTRGVELKTNQVIV